MVYLILVGLAILSRFMGLGSIPLNNSEANHALAAASTTPSASPFWELEEGVTVTAPAYHTTTALLFHLLGATESVARTIPALAGAAIVLTPLVLRKRLGLPTSLVMASLFTLSPILLTSSRMAGGDSLAAFGFTLALMLLIGHAEGVNVTHIFWAAGALGLALAAGPVIFHGLLSLGLAILLWRMRPVSERGLLPESLGSKQLRIAGWIIPGVAVAIASGLGLSFDGVAGLAESVAQWLAGWVQPGDLPALTFAAMIPVYEPLLLVFGAHGAIKSWREDDPFGRLAVLWAASAALMGVVYVSRTPGFLVWVIIPLCYLAAKSVVSIADGVMKTEAWVEFGVLTLIFAVMIAFGYLQLVNYGSGFSTVFTVLDPGLRIWFIGGSLLIAVLVYVFFGIGWSWVLVRAASSTAALGTLLILTVSSAWRLNTSDSTATAQELWRFEVSTPGLSLLIGSLESASLAELGRADSLDVEVRDGASPALAWALRDFERVASQEGIPPSAVVARASASLNTLMAEYYGQVMAIHEHQDWSGALPPDPIRWWVRRNAPTFPERWIVLIRSDIASLGELDAAASEAEP